MANKTVGRSAAYSKHRVVDPMMVAPRRARKDEHILSRESSSELGDFDDIDDTDNFDRDEDFHRSMSRKEVDEITEDDLGLTRRSSYSAQKKPISRQKAKKIEKRKKLQRKWDAKNAKRVANGKKPKNYRRSSIVTRILVTILILVLCAGGAAAYYAYTILGHTTAIFEGSPLDILVHTDLKEDAYGRTNILVFGTSEDAENHGGAELTDSILVLSMDQDLKIASVFSVPRDLWVNYSVDGEDTLKCSVGYQGKINATYLCAMGANNNDKNKASEYFAKKISEVTGLDIQYYVGVDWTVLQSVVDTLGGIDVDVWATDDRGIYDICQGNLKLPKGMNYNLDGETVLRLARARNAHGGYGLASSNFDREKNQQRIINGIRAKALNIGLLAEPNKVISILDSLGENVKTNVKMNEISTVLDFAMNMKGSIESIETQKIYTTGMIGNQSSVIPASGTLTNPYVYTGIHTYLRAQLDAATKKAKSEAEESSSTTSDTTGTTSSTTSSSSSTTSSTK